MEQAKDKNHDVCKTKGYGAGGANTNKNGLSYEELTDLVSEYTIHNSNLYSSTISFKSYPDIELVSTNQSNMFKCMNEHIDHTIEKAHGCKKPDECYIDMKNRIIFIIEKKFQQVGGSVCEKIQTPDFKLWQYNRTFPDYKIVYIYCLSSWFKSNCKAEIKYLNFKNIPVFWGNSPTYKTDIIQFIINYIQGPP